MVIVLDANIASMTKFKQIIGRGTRIRVKPVTKDTYLAGIVDEEASDATTIFDNLIGEGITFEEPFIRYPEQQDNVNELQKREKVYVNGVDISILVSRELYFDQRGKPITTSLKDHTREIIRGSYATLDDFLNQWNAADQKTAITEELQQQGVLVEVLYEAVGKEVDLFDLICHVAYDQSPLTRKERVNNVKNGTISQNTANRQGLSLKSCWTNRDS